ncbi:hypothetical protein [Vibrio vulnificus]|nr:hypothetical protein [Vibrio vulnificus]
MLNWFLDLLEYDISTNTGNLVEVTEVLKKELEDIIGDYQVDLGEKY